MTISGARNDETFTKGAVMKKVLVVTLASILIVLGSIAAYSAVSDNTQYEYYDNGKVREAKSLYPTGEVSSVKYYREDGSLESSVSYNTNGDKTEEANYNTSGTLRENEDGWAAMRWQYYPSGTTASESYYAADGSLKERKTYNEEGDLVDKQYVGDPDMDSEEYNPVPPLAGETEEYYGPEGQNEGATALEYDDGL
jgi:antitoxin component YwqK of YwqJK toxin-antitoxin module